MMDSFDLLPPSWAELIAIAISVAAILLSTIATNKLTKIDVSDKLSTIKDKMRPGRLIMHYIFQKWCEAYSKKIGEDTLRNNLEDKESFMNFYNSRYHNQSSETEGRSKANEIFTYLDELNQLWSRHLNKEFSKKQLKSWFADSITMDANLILTYLDAHWTEHNQQQLEQKNRFWKNVPTIVQEAQKWMK